MIYISRLEVSAANNLLRRPHRFYVTRTVAQQSSNNPQALFPPSFRKIISMFVDISYVTALKKVSSLTWTYFYVKFGIMQLLVSNT